VKLKNLTLILSILFILSNCETIKKKSDELTKNENIKYGKFVGKKINVLKLELGKPTEDFIGENGNKIFVYKSKKYGIECERKFEINESNTIISFTSRGCI
tara:strand:- start:139 stop:441 length:303 start_codon:yes stop_codon:yes gene_type:complete